MTTTFDLAAINEAAPAEEGREMESPFLDKELFTPIPVPEWKTRSTSGISSPFQTELVHDTAASEEQESWREQEFLAGDLQEFDAPSVIIAPDTFLAVPVFIASKRAVSNKLLTPTHSKAAIRWNADRHARTSGIDAASILAALQSYVDVTAIETAITAYNSAHPRAIIALGTKPIDAVFVEAIHQFQQKCYRESSQHDGKAGAGVLDSLGFWPRRGLISAAQTNDWAKRQVRAKRTAIDAALATRTDLTKDLTAANWWNAFVNPSFLGSTFARPIHVYFARKLRQAERWLLTQTRFAGSTPVELATALAINESHAGGRTSAGSKSIHTLGLGIDIKYIGNPHVGDYRDKPVGAKRFSETMHRAVARISGTTLTGTKFPDYLHSLGIDTSKTTGDVYDDLSARDQDLRRYLALPEGRADLAALRTGVFQGSVSRDPLNGFLNMDRDLVIALRDHACLVWGAVDFGAGASGDIMHFDCRLDDLGRAVYCGTGGTFNAQHPCWRRAEAPCPVATRSREVVESECEDEIETEEGADAEEIFEASWAAESVEDFEHPSVEEVEEVEETEQAEQAEELDEVDDFGTDELLLDEELLAADPPPLLKVTPRTEPPGQTIYVEIPLGKDSRCVQWTGEKPNRKCVKYQSFVVKPMTGIFIPQHYTPQSNVDLILYLHGHKTDVPGSDAVIADYWNAKKLPAFGLREELNASGKNVILVAPTLAMKSEGGDLLRSFGLDKYLSKVMAALVAYGPYQGRSPELGNIILAAHSGGGTYICKLANSKNSSAANVRECWGFDSLYNSSDVMPWRQWAAQDASGRQFYSYYRIGLPKLNSESLRKNARGKLQPLPNVHPLAVTGRDHFQMIRPALRERLAATTLLTDTVQSAGAKEWGADEETEEDFGGDD